MTVKTWPTSGGFRGVSVCSGWTESSWDSEETQGEHSIHTTDDAQEPSVVPIGYLV